jgi:hypothetical protein
MNNQEIWKEIDDDVRFIKKNDSRWPDHAAAQAGMVGREAGELMNAAIIFKFHRKKKSDSSHLSEMQRAAIRTAAMAIIFLQNVGKNIDNQKNESDEN